jgi:hypothetical protein
VTRSVARTASTDQIAPATPHPLNELLMNDEPPDPEKVRIRRQPPVPLTLALFLAAVLGFLVVVTGLFTLFRFLDGR